MEAYYGYVYPPELTNEQIWQAAVVWAKLLEGQVVLASEYDAFRRIRGVEHSFVLYVVHEGYSESIAQHRKRVGDAPQAGGALKGEG